MLLPILPLAIDAAASVDTPIWSDVRNAGALLVISGSIIGVIRLLLISQTRSIQTRENSVSGIYKEVLKLGADTVQAVNAHTDSVKANTTFLLKMGDKMDKQIELIEGQRQLLERQILLLNTQQAEAEEKLFDRLERRLNESFNKKKE